MKIVSIFRKKEGVKNNKAGGWARKSGEQLGGRGEVKCLIAGIRRNQQNAFVKEVRNRI